MPAPLPRTITLVRHGRSAHRAGGWVDLDGLRRWRIAYDEAGIVAHEPPPPAIVALARQAPVVVASDMRRARESVARLVEREVPLSPLLREPDLPMPALPGVRLPLAGWALVMGTRWLVEGLRNTPPSPAIGAQAEAAALWLLEHVDAHGSVLAVTHAGLRRHLTRALVARGWRAPERRPYSPWSAWTLTHPAAAALRTTRPDVGA